MFLDITTSMAYNVNYVLYNLGWRSASQLIECIMLGTFATSTGRKYVIYQLTLLNYFLLNNRSR